MLHLHNMIPHWSLVGTSASSIFMIVYIEKPKSAGLSVLEAGGVETQQTSSRSYKSDDRRRRTLHPSLRKRRRVQVGGVGAGVYRARHRSVWLDCSGKQILKGRGDGAAAGPSTLKEIVKANARHFFPLSLGNDLRCSAPNPNQPALCLMSHWLNLCPR